MHGRVARAVLVANGAHFVTQILGTVGDTSGAYHRDDSVALSTDELTGLSG